VEVHHTNTRGSLDAVEAEAVRLVSFNRAVALMGGLTADETAALDRAQVPVLSFYGQPVAGVSNQVFYLGLAPKTQGDALARVAAEDAKRQRAVLVVDERRPESAALADAFVKAWTEARASKEPKDAVPPLLLRFGKDARWSELLERIRASDPHAILFAGAVPEFSTWYRAYQQEVFLTEPLILFGGEDGAARLFDIDPQAKVVLATAFPADAGTEKAKAFVKAYQATFHSEPDVHAAVAYDSFLILADALKRAKPQLTPERLRNALQETNLEGLTGNLKMNADRQVQRPLFVARWHRGALTTIKKFP
jgi:branched-chain amino acid transport system substrate-binding protein